jgi:hypothetical protein
LAKTKISSTDLIWIFRESLSSFDDCPPSIPIAIVPSDESWTAVTAQRVRKEHPNCVKRIEQIQKQLREVYVLAKDWTPAGQYSRHQVLRLGASGRGAVSPPAHAAGFSIAARWASINIAVVIARDQRRLSWGSSFWSLARYLLLLGFSGSDKGRDYSQGRTMLYWSTPARAS